ncbi:MAG: hypothetical protein KIH89_003810 [Candidatus Shapirobacteria bacterium]|nr:hypothetical protein [Candidatus Shapirobacteria bacterium]
MQEQEKAGLRPTKSREKELTHITDLIRQNPNSPYFNPHPQISSVGLQIISSSEEYMSQMELAHKSVIDIEPNESYFYTAFCKGLGICLEIAHSNPEIQNIPRADLIESYLVFSRKSIKSFKHTGSNDSDLLRLIISSPHLIASDRFEVLFDIHCKYRHDLSLRDIEDVIKQNPQNISQAIELELQSQKTPDNQTKPPTCDIEKPDPSTPPQKPSIETPTRAPQRTCFIYLIDQPETKITQITEPEIISRNTSTTPSTTPTEETSLETNHLYTFAELRNMFPNKNFFTDWVLEYFLSRYQTRAESNLRKLVESCNESQEKNKSYSFFDSQTIKAYAALFPLNYEPMLRQCDRIMASIQTKRYRFGKNPFFENNDMIKIIVFREMYNAEKFISENSRSFADLITTNKDNPFINGNLNLLFYYFLRYGPNVEHHLRTNTELFNSLKKQYQETPKNNDENHQNKEDQKHSSVQLFLKQTGDNFLRFAILQKDQDTETYLTTTEKTYQELISAYQGNKTLETYFQEAAIIFACFYPETANRKMQQLIQKIDNAKDTINRKSLFGFTPETQSRIISAAIRCNNDEFKKILEDSINSPTKCSHIPKNFNFNHLIYKMFFDFNSLPIPQPKLQP